jgi:hypothetical protein
LKRTALIVCVGLAVAGTIAVWWLSRYLNNLVALAETDREAALLLFRSRVLPALFAIVAISAAAGAIMIRQGLRVVRESRAVASLMVAAGILMAAVPTILLVLVFWLLGRV